VIYRVPAVTTKASMIQSLSVPSGRLLDKGNLSKLVTSSRYSEFKLESRSTYRGLWCLPVKSRRMHGMIDCWRGYRGESFGRREPKSSDPPSTTFYFTSSSSFIPSSANPEALHAGASLRAAVSRATKVYLSSGWGARLEYTEEEPRRCGGCGSRRRGSQEADGDAIAFGAYPVALSDVRTRLNLTTKLSDSQLDHSLIWFRISMHEFS